MHCEVPTSSDATLKDLALAALPALNPTAVLLFCPRGELAYANPAAHQLLSTFGVASFEELLPEDHSALILGPLPEGTARTVELGAIRLGWAYRRDLHTGLTSLYARESIASGVEQRLIRDLQSSLARGDLDAFYQPIVDGRHGELIGFEALARWRRADGSWIAPDTFIPIAERFGAIVEVDLQILGRAFGALQRWTEAGATVTVNVNVSAYTLTHAHFLPALQERLEASGLAPGSVCVEVTESSLANDPAAALRAVARLRELGVHVAMDDFGTGYSSLAYLQRFPIDRLKLDRTLISDVVDNPRTRHILAAVCNLARVLGLHITAEGIETESQWQAIRHLGVDMAQGYWFGRALPEVEAAARLRALPEGPMAVPFPPLEQSA